VGTKVSGEFHIDLFLTILEVNGCGSLKLVDADACAVWLAMATTCTAGVDMHLSAENNGIGAYEGDDEQQSKLLHGCCVESVALRIEYDSVEASTT